jgi:hypothetical protein
MAKKKGTYTDGKTDKRTGLMNSIEFFFSKILNVIDSSCLKGRQKLKNMNEIELLIEF